MRRREVLKKGLVLGLGLLIPLRLSESSQDRFKREIGEGKRHWKGETINFKKLVDFPNRGEKVVIENCKLKYKMGVSGIQFAMSKNIWLTKNHFYPI